MTEQNKGNDAQARADAKPLQEGKGGGDLGQLCQNVLPVWSGQIEMARAHVEDAALNLVSHFVGIASRIDQIAQTLAGAEAAVSSMAKDAAAQPADNVATLQEAFRVLREEREAISQAVHRGIVALQFQDRVSQVLGHVRRDLEKLRERVDEHGRLPESFNVGAWLDELIKTYSMEQQRDVHFGGDPSAKVDIGDVTLF
jgi:methyl-accepting chemotaxis protein